MSSFSVENLLNDAIKLSLSLKECEIESDRLILQSVNITKDNENIKEASIVRNVENLVLTFCCFFVFKFVLLILILIHNFLSYSTLKK